jgi:tetratricopeptide (TPR) repeat protein
VSAGTAKLEAGDSEQALKLYDEAQRELGDKPELHFDRGNALYRMGKYKEAREAYAKAMDGPDGALKARDYYNMGNALAHMDEPQEASRAFRRSLALDPSDEAARYNLEVMLRRIKDNKKGPPKDEEKSPPDGGRDGGQDGGSDGGSDDGGKPDAGARDGGRPDGGSPDAGSRGEKDGGSGGDGSADAGQPDAGAQDDRATDGGPKDGGTRAPMPLDGGAQGDGGVMDGGVGAEAGAPPPAPEVGKQQAEKLLDALKAREKNLPMWKVESKKKKSHVEKDW